MKGANFAPVYCALYPKLAEITRKHGYALAVHGTLGRDMDLICIPWVPVVSEPRTVIDEMTSTFDLWLLFEGKPTAKEHGREAYTICIGFGECAIDLSFMPRVS